MGIQRPRDTDRVPLPLYSGGYSGDSSPLSSYSLLNMYPQKILGEQDNDVALIGTSGLRYLTNLASGQHRSGGAIEHEGAAYFIVGTNVMSYDTTGTATNRGSINTSGGYVGVSSNGVTGGQLTIVDGADGWVWDGATLSQIVDAQFPSSPTDTCFIDGYTVVLDEDSDTFYLSDFYDSTAYSTVFTARAERNPDGLLRCCAYSRQLWLLGRNTTEVWYNSGNTFPFDPVPNMFLQYGIAAAGSLAVHDEKGLMWISRDTKSNLMPVHVTSSGSREIGPPQLLEKWRDYQTVEDAIAVSYQEGANTFYEVTFPTVQKTWVCNITNNYSWFEKQYTQDKRSLIQNHVFFNNKNLVGDYRNGNLYEIDHETYTDNGNYIARELTLYHISSTREQVRHVYLELEMETGVGLVSGQGSDPLIWMQFSDDLGRTFGNKRYLHLGEGGNYTIEIKWPMLGKSKNRVYRIGISDPVKIRINRAILGVQGASH